MNDHNAGLWRFANALRQVISLHFSHVEAVDQHDNFKPAALGELALLSPSG
jgi:hypothetical protein